jgi:hypothetical protein
MVVTGGIGVLVVIAFVAAVALGRDHTVAAGDRIAVVESKGPAKLTVLVGRCDDERVDAVDVRSVEGAPLWRIESADGSIARRFVVGEDPPPFGFVDVTKLGATLSGAYAAEVEIDGVTDREIFDTTKLDQERAPRAPCDGNDIGVVSILFILGALGVVGAYGVMVRRYLSAR